MTFTVTDNGNGTATLSGDLVIDDGDGTDTAPGVVTDGVATFVSSTGGLSWHTLNLNFADIEGDPLAGGTVFVSYDRTVRTPDMLVPNPAADGVAIPLVGMASVQVLSSDDPSLTADSAGFGIVVRVVWTDADANYQRKSKTYKAQVLSADPSTVNLSAKIGAQTVPAQLVDMSTVLANSNTAATDAAASAAAAINAANLVDAPPDNVIATAVNGAGTATQTALDGRYLKSASANSAIDAHLGGDSTSLVPTVAAKVSKDRQVVWLEDQSGIATDGVTDCGAAFQAAINAAEAAGVTLKSKPGRVYNIGTQSLTFKKSVDFWDSTISYAGTGTAVTLGDPVNGVTRQHFRVGRVVAATKISPGWGDVTGSVGVLVVDANKSRIDIKSITQFETGVKMLGHARGSTYNKTYVEELVTNKVNMWLTADAAAGFCNQNLIVGGSWNHDATSSGGSSYVAGTKHVLQNSTGGAPVPDNNLFSHCAFEGAVVEYMVDSAGKMNTFRDCRWETTNPVAKVRWQAGSYGNVIRDGYRPDLIQPTNAGDYTNSITWPASGDVAEVVIMPSQLIGVSGAPAAATLLRHPIVNMANAGSDVVAFTARTPLNWHTYTVEVHVTNTTAGTGTTAWLVRANAEGAGDALTQPAGGTASALTAMPAQNVKAVMAATQAPLTTMPGKQTTVNLISAGGTYSGAVSILAVVLRRAS